MNTKAIFWHAAARTPAAAPTLPDAVCILLGTEPNYTAEMIAEVYARARSHKWWGEALEGRRCVDEAACVLSACIGNVLVCCGNQFHACIPNEYGSWMWGAIADDSVRLFVKYCFVEALRLGDIEDPADEENSDDGGAKFTDTWIKRVAKQCKNTLRDDAFMSKLGSTAHQWQPFDDGLRNVNAHDARVRPMQPDDYVGAEQTVGYAFGGSGSTAELAALGRAVAACNELEDAMLVACSDNQSTFDYMYAALALCFTGIATPQRMCFVLLGEGGNFKTSFVALLRLLLGALFVPLADETVTKRFAAGKPRSDLASLCGAYVAANDDVDSDLLSAPVRKLLGDGGIAIRRPYAPGPEMIEPQCHLVVGGHCGMSIVSNHNDYRGLQRRVRVLDMPIAFTLRDQYQPNGLCAVAASRERMEALMLVARPALVRRLIAKAQQCASQYAGSFFLPTDCRAVQAATEAFLNNNCPDTFRLWWRTVTAVPSLGARSAGDDDDGDVVELPQLFRRMPAEPMGEREERQAVSEQEMCAEVAMQASESTSAAASTLAASTTASTSTASTSTASTSTASATPSSAVAKNAKIIAVFKAREAIKAEAAAPLTEADAGGMDGPTGKFLFASFEGLRKERRRSGLDQHVPTRNRKSRVPRHADGAVYIDRQAFYARMTAVGVCWSISNDRRVRRAANYVWRDSLTPEERAEQRARFNAAIRRDEERRLARQPSLYGAAANTTSESGSAASESE